MQEVLGVSFVLVWLHKRQPLRCPKRNGSKCWEFGNQFDCCVFSLFWIHDIHVIIEELSQSSHHTAHDRHWMSIGFESLVEVLDLRMHQHLFHDFLLEDCQLLSVW